MEYRCPGCTGGLGMGELRSLMISGNMFLKYKLANGYLINENAKLSPYIYAGAGINQLSDVMKKECVNVGTHYSIVGGTGIKYNITNRLNVSYNAQIGYFHFKKVYNSGSLRSSDHGNTPEEEKIHHTKDKYLQHSLALGLNFGKFLSR